MKFNVLKLISVSLFISLLSACSWIPKPSFLQYRDKNYLTARAIPPIKIPPGASSSQFENQYPIPDRNYQQDQKDVSLAPPGL